MLSRTVQARQPRCQCRGGTHLAAVCTTSFEVWFSPHRLNLSGKIRKICIGYLDHLVSLYYNLGVSFPSPSGGC